MKPLLIAALTLLALGTYAHGPQDAELPLQEFHLRGHRHLHASFLMMRGDSVFLETARGSIEAHPLSAFEAGDQRLLQQKRDAIALINQGQPDFTPVPPQKTLRGTGRPWLPWGLLLSALVAIPLAGRKRRWPLVALLGGAALLTAFRSGVARTLFGTDPAFLEAAFAPFKPHVSTHWDANWYYVESNGLPTTHSMMTGIVKWQQQVPIPQCYIGNNAWQIPLNPVIAAQPVPVNDQHFLRGAIALATNGIPIFNPHTNTGVDALLDGQLDQWGGHSGRADDYHYHIAPLFLDTQSAEILPIAFGLDGFAVYAGKEPDGSPMAPLDANHGHFGTDGMYHYHGTPEAPYMIGNMVGQVTEDATLQIVPQPKAKPVRPSLTPLNGATITGFEPNGTGNGFNLTYTRNGQTYRVNYDWTSSGTYTYRFISPTDTVTEVYNTGAPPCESLTDTEEPPTDRVELLVFPNPSTGRFTVQVSGPNAALSKPLWILDLQGRPVLSKTLVGPSTEIEGLSQGVYLVRIGSGKEAITRKIVVQ